MTGNAGSENSDSGGNSTQPPALFNAEFRPTKVDRTSDVTGLVDVGDLTSLGLTQADAVAVMPFDVLTLYPRNFLARRSAPMTQTT